MLCCGVLSAFRCFYSTKNMYLYTHNRAVVSLLYVVQIPVRVVRSALNGEE